MSDDEWEPITDSTGEAIAYQRFACEAPPEGVSFVVVRDEWSADGTHRTIHEVRL